MRTRPSPIQSSPNELLCRILKTIIDTTPSQCDPHRVQKHELETVCPRWRDIIVNTPSFWTSVQLAPTWKKALVKVHLERSRKCLLDLVAGFRSRTKFIALLKIVTPKTQRWRSLTTSLQDTQVDDALFILQNLTAPCFLYSLLSIPTLPSTREFKRYSGNLLPIRNYSTRKMYLDSKAWKSGTTFFRRMTSNYPHS